MDAKKEIAIRELKKSMREAFDTGNDLDGYAYGEQIKELDGKSGVDISTLSFGLDLLP